MSVTAMRRLYQLYLGSMTAHPWRTTIISTGVLSGLGDVLAQQVVEKRGIAHHNFRRTGNMAGLGLMIIGPGLRTWYLMLEKLVRGSGAIAAVKRVILDQTVWAPTILATILTTVDILNGRSFVQVRETLSKKYFEVLKANYMLWPWVQVANFYFVPLQHRVLVVNVVALFWNTYLAWISNQILSNKIELIAYE